MTLPEPIVTFALTLPSPADHAGEGQRARYSITPSDEITSAATRLRLLPDVLEYEVKAGESRVVNLPHPQQPGMIDPNGADITGWHYVVTTAVLVAGRWTDRPGRRIVQPLAGTTAVNIALVPDQEPARRAETVTPVDRALTARDEAERAADRSRDYANDADLSAGRAAQYVTDAGLQADRADEHRRAAELAADDAGIERAGAGEERAAAQLARTGAEAARDVALAGQFAGSNLQLNTNLNTVTTPGVYRQITATDLRALNYPNQSSLGVLVVYTTTNTIVQEFTVSTNAVQAARGKYIRRMIISSGLWTPWYFIPTQRVDQTAGRAIYTWDELNNREQLIYGDTGMRDLGSLRSSAFTGGIFLRRVGQQVQLWGEITATAEIAVNAEVDILSSALPSGFSMTSIGWVRQPFRLSGGSHDAYIRFSNPATVRAVGSPVPTNQALRFMISWFTTDAWPTVLPGVASGGIPNV